MIDFSNEPYFDDFSENKEFYKVLFRPTYAVQARELNQIQSILQNQTSAVGQHLFKEGSVVIPGKINYDNNCKYVKLQPLNQNSADISSYVNDLQFTIITGESTGIKAVVLHVEQPSGSDPYTLYVRYLSGGNSGETVFLENENLTEQTGTYTVVSAFTSATGTGTIATLSEGIYFIKNTFVKVFNSILVLSKYNSIPSCKVGIKWTESIVTPDDDESLLDNAAGSPNYAAPGAHRYKISTELYKIGLDETLENFIELINVNAGDAVLTQVYPKYNEVADELARRTYKESGDYVSQGFDLELNEHHKNNRGSWTASTQYYIGDIISRVSGSNTYFYQCIHAGTSGATTPSFGTTFGTTSDTGGSSVVWNYVEVMPYNDGLFTNGDPSKYVISNRNGSAFVKGYEYTSTGLTRYVNDKPREYARQNNGTITTYDGTYILVQNIYGYPANIGTNFDSVNLYDTFTSTPGSASGTLVGTAKVRWFEQDSGSSNYRLYLYDITMSNGYTFSANCKQIQATGFTADIVPVLTQLSGSITASSTAVVGTGTLFSTQVASGSYITVDSTGALSNMRKLSGAPASNVALTLTASLTTTGTVFYGVTTKLYNTTYNSAIFKMPHTVIRNLKSADDITTDTNYTFTKDFGTFTASGTSYSISLSSGVETFANVGNAANYLLFNTSTKLPVSATYSVNGASTTLTVAGLTNGVTYKLIGTVNKTATPRTKTLVTGQYVDFTTETAVNALTLSLGKADCYRVVAIKQSDAFGTITSGGANDALYDVSGLFKFDSGQNSLYYGISSVIRTNYQVKITGSIRVYFEYFTHSNGDYFTVESYANAIPYTDIEPKLRDTIDFRPVRNDSDTGFDQGTVGVLKSGNNVTADYSYYLPRVDALVLSKTGTISLINGQSALYPKQPAIPVDSIVLYYFYNSAYGGNPNQTVTVVSVPQKGYTMADINNLENRIARLEDYTSYTLLEKSTAELDIKDQQGYNMFKNGFLVESFNDVGLGDVSDPDYRCFINSSTNELYPPQTEDVVTFLENGNQYARLVDGYTINNDIITLNYEEVEYTSNLMASRPVNVNPFSVASFVGNIKLTPSSDVWMDTETLPTIYR